MKPTLSMIVAMDINGCIGKGNKIPWGREIPSDLKRFARLTKGHVVIQGRKTFESIIENLGYPLSHRTNIVLSRQSEFEAERCQTFAPRYITDMIQIAKNLESGRKCPEVFVIGGEEVYRQFFQFAEKLYITIVDAIFCGDKFFPSINDSEWNCARFENCSVGTENDKYETSFSIYERKKISDKKVSFVEIDRARSTDQRELMKQIKRDSVCPFCPDNLHKYHPEPILQEGEFWVLTRNMSPYENSTHSMLLIYKEHETNPFAIPRIAIEEAHKLFQFYCALKRIKGGTFIWRWGDSRWNGASVNHLHMHLIVGSGTSKKQTRIRIG